MMLFNRVDPFLDALKDWEEPQWGAVSTKGQKHPTGRTCDNHLLYTATKIVHLRRLFVADARLSGQTVGQYQTAHPDTAKRVWAEVYKFERFVRACEIEPGLYLRWPGDDKGPTTHDDLTGIAVASRLWMLPMAEEIFDFGRANHWVWHKEPVWKSKEARKNYLGFPRIPDFAPTIIQAGGGIPNLFQQWAYKQALHWNTFEAARHTSGKCLIYLKNQVMEGVSPAVDDTIFHWRVRMSVQYPEGLKQVYAVYFGDDHPLTQFAGHYFA